MRVYPRTTHSDRGYGFVAELGNRELVVKVESGRSVDEAIKLLDVGKKSHGEIKMASMKFVRLPLLAVGVATGLTV
jgi:hypothetical protein